jgi:hypothetical protein
LSVKQAMRALEDQRRSIIDEMPDADPDKCILRDAMIERVTGSSAPPTFATNRRMPLTRAAADRCVAIY